MYSKKGEKFFLHVITQRIMAVKKMSLA